MEISLVDAATILGRSERQVRYMIRQKTLPARKDGSRWLIRTEDLPLTETQR